MNLKRISVLLTGLLVFAVSYAGPVRDRRVVLSQPDGTTIRAVITGDEFGHTVKDISGRFLAQGEDGFWHIVPSAPEGNREKRTLRSRKSAEMRLRTKAMSAGGAPVQKHSIIILAETKDCRMKASREDFVRMLTEKGYNRSGATGSAKDYFDAQFRGDYEFSFEISPIVTLGNESAYYFGNDRDGTDKNPEEAVKEACQKAFDMGMSFAQGDHDGDGEVDNIFLFIAGKDEADGGGEDCVWSHMYYLDYTKFKGFSVDGVVINNYAISTELKLNGNGRFSFTSIGTFCHEYSHSLGLADLYDTDYAGSGGYGNGLWVSTALMDGGNSNNEFNTPPSYNAIDFDLLGLGNCEPLEPGRYTLEPITRDRRYLKLETAIPGESYLLEYREEDGWDSYIGGSGLLIYHVDRSTQRAGVSDSQGITLNAFDRWSLNEVNCRPDRQCAMLVPPENGLKAYDANGHFLYNQEKAFWKGGEFSPVTSPGFVLWNGKGCGLAISDIVLNGGSVSFTVSSMGETIIPGIILEDTDIFQDAVIINWASSDTKYTGTATVVLEGISRELKTYEVEPYEPGKYSLTITGLEPMKAYSASVSFRVGSMSSQTVQVSFTTKRRYDEGFPYIFLYNADRTPSGALHKGTAIPLRVYNAVEAESISWFLDGDPVSVGADGYYHVSESGMLKAVVRYGDGSSDILVKYLVVE